MLGEKGDKQINVFVAEVNRRSADEVGCNGKPKGGRGVRRRTRLLNMPKKIRGD